MWRSEKNGLLKHLDDKHFNCHHNKEEYFLSTNNRLECMENCRVDCWSSEFKPEIKGKDLFKNTMRGIMEFEIGNYPNNTILVGIDRKGTDIQVRHLPKTSFISLVCSFGGLLGLWLGMSVLTIMKISTQFIKNYFINNIVQVNRNAPTRKLFYRREDRQNQNIRPRFIQH